MNISFLEWNLITHFLILLLSDLVSLLLRLAYGIGSGYSTVRHSRHMAEVFDSDLLPILAYNGKFVHVSNGMNASLRYFPKLYIYIYEYIYIYIYTWLYIYI